MAYTLPAAVVVPGDLVHGQYQKGTLVLEASLDKETWVTVASYVVPDHTHGHVFQLLPKFPYPFARFRYVQVVTDTGSISLTISAKGN
jgi:hypothetical protein